MDNKEKIVDKIKKCLALGKSNNPHEAAAALRQAQKLMEMHGLSEDDLEKSGYGNEAVECPIQANKKATPVHLSRLVNLVMRAFQVKAVIETNVRVSDISYRVRYFGPTHRVQMAGYAHVVIYRAMEAAWRDALANESSWKGVRGARLSFMVGWLAEIASKVEAIGWPAGEEERTELVKNEFYGHQLVKNKGRRVLIKNDPANMGRSAASDFNINRPMTGTQVKRIGNS